MSDDIATTLGAVIIGIPLGIMFSGTLLVQCILYFRSVRPRDTWRMSSIVCTFLVLDTLHSCLLWAAAWKWFIVERGTRPDFIPTPMACLFMENIPFNHNYWISTPIVSTLGPYDLLIPVLKILLAALRVVAATGEIYVLDAKGFFLNCETVSTSEMVKLQSFEAFRSKIGWVFSVGLALSSIVDVLITGVMMIILRQSRKKSLSLDSVLDSLIIYTFETGSITAIATIASLITWLALDNLIFLALHFVIAKLYANSVVAMLNYRQSLNPTQPTSSRSGNAIDLEVIRLDRNPATQLGRQLIFPSDSARSQSEPTSNVAPVEVNVTKTMEMHTDDSLMDEFKGEAV
ncbi:hypothetical protein BT96DRAFT_991198 [Gymnopus androsaceus JB14]|uniref:DUF6534 domain-containing protein n=1 Tax=Gymnopus androsaceus JB14 TaxID=1447944 RepID=A0A6A4I0T7_9AGAR|nr:hypothetical protein BT96DRAFT_991198 [Gymnopus androsaceus JB14]